MTIHRFIPGATQESEDARWVSNFIFLFLVLIKEIRRQDESKIPLHRPCGGKLLIRTSASYNKLLGRGVFRAWLGSKYGSAWEGAINVERR